MYRGTVSLIDNHVCNKEYFYESVPIIVENVCKLRIATSISRVLALIIIRVIRATRKKQPFYLHAMSVTQKQEQ